MLNHYICTDQELYKLVLMQMLLQAASQYIHACVQVVTTPKAVHVHAISYNDHAMGDKHVVVMQKLLQAANQYICAYVQVVTSTTASSIQAAGIQIGLPSEVGRLIAFLQQVSRAFAGHGAVEKGQSALQGRASLKQSLPAFLLDIWQCLALSEESS